MGDDERATISGTELLGDWGELALAWRERGAGEPPYLAGARYLHDGTPHGFAYAINEDQQSVSEEQHYKSGQPHGIERAWDARGRLRRGFPRFWIDGARATRARYERAWEMGGGLPPYRPADDAPARAFPPEIARHLRATDPDWHPPIARYQFIIGIPREPS